MSRTLPAAALLLTGCSSIANGLGLGIGLVVGCGIGVVLLLCVFATINAWLK